MPTDTINGRVALGAAYLDEHEPGWERRVDLAALDIQHGCRCILGQVVPRPRTNAGGYFHYLREHGLSDMWAAARGFTFLDWEPKDWDALEGAWISLIKERFASGLLSDEATS